MPAGVSAEATSAAGASVAYAVSATDLVDGAVAVSCSTPSGSTFALGSATDAHGNTGHAAFDVTVGDSRAPSLTLPGTITTDATSPAGAVVTYDATASDIVDGAITPSCSPASGATFAVGSTTVDCTATDAHGNSATGSFVVNVVDNTAPTLVVPSTIVVNATSPDGAIVTYVVTAADSVGGALTPSCSPASGATFAIGTTTVTCTAADAEGNTSSAQFAVQVKGALEQLLDLQQAVRALQVGGLGSSVRNLIRAVADRDTARTCKLIDQFDAQLAGSLGKKLTADQRDWLREELARISNVLGCATTP